MSYEEFYTFYEDSKSEDSVSEASLLMHYLFPRKLLKNSVTREEAIKAYKIKSFFEKYQRGLSEVVNKMSTEVEEEVKRESIPQMDRLSSFRDDSILWFTNLGRISSITVFQEEWNIEDNEEDGFHSKVIKKFPKVSTIKKLVSHYLLLQVEIEEEDVETDETGDTNTNRLDLTKSPSVNEERKDVDKMEYKSLPILELERGASKKPCIDGLQFTTKFIQEMAAVYGELKKTWDTYVELLITKPALMHKILSTIRDNNYQDYIGKSHH